jgi:hypothetical protein
MNIFIRLGFALSLLILSEPAHAYVDPGVVGTLFQLVYAIFFGGVVIFFAKPIDLFKSMMARIRGTPKIDESSSSASNNE